jgi:hypothetical protein
LTLEGADNDFTYFLYNDGVQYAEALPSGITGTSFHLTRDVNEAGLYSVLARLKDHVGTCFLFMDGEFNAFAVVVMNVSLMQ